MLEQLGHGFRKLSGILSLVGVLVTFYTLVFADIRVGRNGQPKPPLNVQLLQTGGLIAVGLPGILWGVVRATQGKQRTPWE